MSDTITQDITDNRYVSIPTEWFDNPGFQMFDYAQATLLDDRIAISKPLTGDTEYLRSCKLPDGSYICRIDFINGVHLPPKLLQALGIESGDKLDLTLEEHCISIRKNKDVNEPLMESDPVMAFCCVCGDLLYTENGLTKVASKYICGKCIDTVKAL